MHIDPSATQTTSLSRRYRSRYGGLVANHHQLHYCIPAVAHMRNNASQSEQAFWKPLLWETDSTMPGDGLESMAREHLSPACPGFPSKRAFPQQRTIGPSTGRLLEVENCNQGNTLTGEMSSGSVTHTSLGWQPFQLSICHPSMSCVLELRFGRFPPESSSGGKDR